ncbi:unnamed protein product [Mucor fragilis]
MHKPSLKHYHLPTKSSLSTAATSSTSCTSSQLPLSIDTTSHAIHRECILFPTYAFRDPSKSDRWIVRTKGWALSMKKPGPKQRVLKGITKSVAGKGSGTHQHANKMFENRFKYFMAKGKRNKKIQVEAIGAATNAEWIHLGNNPTRLKSPLTPPPSATISTPHDDLEDFQLHKHTSTQWQKIYDATKKYMDQPATTAIHDHDGDDVGPLPTLLNTSYAPTSMASNTDHYGAPTSSDEDDEEEEGDGSCDEASGNISPLNENGITLKSEGTGVFQGEFRISDQQVEKWIRDGNHASPEEQDEERMIKIRSCSKREDHHTTAAAAAKKNFFFPLVTALCS